MAADPRELVLQANTQLPLSAEVRLGAGNFWKARYTAPDGEEQEGLTCGLWIVEGSGQPQRHLRVHPGASLRIADFRLEVREISERQVRLSITAA
ncbi:MAG TPA: hypothetical protein VK013_03195 [Myxococcaceae bacterium]|nr:hypothetical protein [Myxococcaceae bacterium]